MVTIWSMPRLSSNQNVARLEQNRRANPTVVARTTDARNGTHSHHDGGSDTSKAIAPSAIGGMPRASAWKATLPSQLAYHQTCRSTGRYRSMTMSPSAIRRASSRSPNAPEIMMKAWVRKANVARSAVSSPRMLPPPVVATNTRTEARR